MNKFFDPDPSEFEKLEKERIIKELEKVIQKTEREGREEDVEKLKKELKALTHESFWDILFKPIY
ncbi:hypothetical protein [Fusobacterium pseudoperiodonticum]|jgi:hypothetical protein|uniref:Uncharacterized protein n=1 Tax=Fusobacterium pseudoperiodonticum TaxID=2663009 RepID=A0AAD0AP21_9FUSO|nr:hypothetical protein [Fusobacterium pseudoperiodonticum]ATV34951.1 hypothetical protein CTM64_02185 [Fusobacterium pseudoperiodonticum]ATV62155.1 hypothetical protein CTM74_10145 [Fusobacterium pseudoperiodonticum]